MCFVFILTSSKETSFGRYNTFQFKVQQWLLQDQERDSLSSRKRKCRLGFKFRCLRCHIELYVVSKLCTGLFYYTSKEAWNSKKETTKI